VQILHGALWNLAVPLDAIALPPAWQGELEWRVPVEWNEPSPETVDDTIGPLELVLAARPSGIKMHFEMKGGLSAAGARWIAQRLGGRPGRLAHH
jgi:hypothetical protein